jgi:hypothetical protein
MHQQQKDAEFKKNRTAHDLNFAYDARQKHKLSKKSSDAIGVRR